MKKTVFFGLLAIISVSTSFIIQALGNKNSNKISYIYPVKGTEFEFELKTVEEVQQDQVFYHVSYDILTEAEVVDYMKAQQNYVRETYEGGDIYAFGYHEKTGSNKFVFAPANGGRIEPGKSRMADRLYFYDKDDRLLAIMTQPSGSGWSFQTQEHSGHAANIPKRVDGIRNFHYVFTLDSPEIKN